MVGVRQGLECRNVATEPFRVVSQPIVALQNVQLTLTSRAGPVEVLRDVCLRVEAGQSLAVVGPSGSGKTSLLMVVAGLERATRATSRLPGTTSRSSARMSWR